MSAESKRNSTEPLNHSEFLILLALADQERHGYGIMQEIETGTGGSVKFGPGTLYGAIKRLIAAGWVEESPNRPASKHDDDRRRCYYRLTRAGRVVANAEATRLADLVRVARSKNLAVSRNLLPTGTF